MEETEIGIEVLLSLLGVAGLSILGMLFLHSTRSGIRFRAAAATEPPLWSGWVVLLALLGYQILIGFFSVSLKLFGFLWRREIWPGEVRQGILRSPYQSVLKVFLLPCWLPVGR